MGGNLIIGVAKEKCGRRAPIYMLLPISADLPSLQVVVLTYEERVRF